MTKTDLMVAIGPPDCKALNPFSSTMSYLYATSLDSSPMIGKVNFLPPKATSSMSLIHSLWDGMPSADKPINLTFLASNSGFNAAKAPNSVVQTGVKSAGWENKTPQELPKYWWKSISPTVVGALKFGAAEPILILGWEAASKETNLLADALKAEFLRMDLENIV